MILVPNFVREEEELTGNNPLDVSSHIVHDVIITIRQQSGSANSSQRNFASKEVHSNVSKYVNDHYSYT